MYWAAIVDLCECQDELGDIAKITVSTVDFCGFLKVCNMAKKNVSYLMKKIYRASSG